MTTFPGHQVAELLFFPSQKEKHDDNKLQLSKANEQGKT